MVWLSGTRRTLGTISSRTGPPGALGPRQRALATSADASVARRSKSRGVTARCRVRKLNGPRFLASLTVSASAPPLAEAIFVTLSIKATVERRLVKHPRPNVASRPSPVAVRPHDYLGADRRYRPVLVPGPIGVPDRGTEVDRPRAAVKDVVRVSG